ncbi:hypothetical protein AXK11_01545 [Cephaloticoccus primus]|uniref:Uncharacterized protein n=1 Tax=Cephaloticoccus primus TaxID=1548207 RepID=A0A139STM2_9BACT|nr:hypothetical protein [Cephaloticoccus primus]KXU37864.1 hypothetical protein AXK11_01545 [Cephaloticoccus primus]
MPTATIQLPSSVYQLAEQASTRRGFTVPQFLAEVIKEQLAPTPSAPSPAWKDVPWMQTAGALADLHEENKRIKALLTAEFRSPPSTASCAS